MDIVDKIKVAKSLKDIKVWQYAKLHDLLQVEPQTDQEKVNIMCEVLELSTDKPAHVWREQYKTEFTLMVFGKVEEAIKMPLPVEPLDKFLFTTLTPEDNRAQLQEIEQANFFKRKRMRINLEIDNNRLYHIEKMAGQTFEQVIQTEMILREIVSLDAGITAMKQFNKLPRLLAFICKLDGEQFHYFDANDHQYKFNYSLIDYREQVFMHLDIETAWRVYLAFFLTGRKLLTGTSPSGTE